MSRNYEVKSGIVNFTAEWGFINQDICYVNQMCDLIKEYSTYPARLL